MNCFPTRTIVSLILLAQASACAADQSALTNTPAPACEQVEALLEILGTQSIFTSTPEEFLRTTQDLLQVGRDNTSSPAPGMTMRKIEFAPVKTWLDSGEINYDVEEGKTVFDGATFGLSTNCFSGPEQLLAISAKSLGAKYTETQTPPPEIITNRTWYWPDPDINYIRFIDLYAGSDLYHLKVERDPAPQEGD